MITPTTAATPQILSGTQAPAADQTVLNSDYNTFLKMLTAQVMNQDPLNPLDSTEYASQLATFSAVEQQVVTNDLLSSMVSLLGSGGLSDLAGWVGQEVRSEAPAYFKGDPISLSVSQALSADYSVLEVYDDEGTLLQTHPLTPDQTSFEWDGLDDAGEPLPEGQYSFVVDNFTAGESIGLTPVSTYNEVNEALIDGGQIYLVLAGGFILTPEAVTGIRQ
ncbi:MAG: flagellar basal body rod modification protein [Rhodobacteraceae bacterium]|nr:MAG: flagellar basal body rod modification protein [Paracoccaceae bacterium]